MMGPSKNGREGSMLKMGWEIPNLSQWITESGLSSCEDIVEGGYGKDSISRCSITSKKTMGIFWLSTKANRRPLHSKLKMEGDIDKLKKGI